MQIAKQNNGRDESQQQLREASKTFLLQSYNEEVERRKKAEDEARSLRRILTTMTAAENGAEVSTKSFNAEVRQRIALQKENERLRKIISDLKEITALIACKAVGVEDE